MKQGTPQDTPAPGTVCRCYVRVSTKDQRPEVQVPQMERFCAERGWTPVFYEERMKGSRADRPEFLRAVGDALKGLSDRPQAFLVWALDRFGRDQLFLLGQLQALEAAGVTVSSLAEPWVEEDDDTKPILLGVTSGMAATELRRLRRRTAAAQALARDEGKHIGRPFKSLSLLQEASRLVVSNTCGLREAVRRVNHGVPKKPAQPGGLCQISVATLRRFLNGAWKGQGAPAEPVEHSRRRQPRLQPPGAPGVCQNDQAPERT